MSDSNVGTSKRIEHDPAKRQLIVHCSNGHTEIIPLDESGIGKEIVQATA